MYALVYKDRVLTGPTDWLPGFFEYALNKEGINNVLIPKKSEAAGGFPFVINNDAKIFEVKFDKTDINPMTQYHRGPLWTIGEDVVTATYEIVELEIEFARSNFKKQAADERYKKEISGIKVTIQNKEVEISTQRIERNQYFDKASKLSDGQTINWKFGNDWLQVSKEELLSISSSIDSHVQSTFDWEKVIAEQIDAANSSEELLAIEILPPKTMSDEQSDQE